MQISNGATLGTTRAARFHFAKTLFVFLPLGRILNFKLGSAVVLRFFLWGPLAPFNDPRTKKKREGIAWSAHLFTLFDNKQTAKVPRGGPSPVARGGDKKQPRIETGLVNDSPMNKEWRSLNRQPQTLKVQLFFSSRSDYRKFAVRPPLRMKRCKNQHSSSGQWKRLQLCLASNVWGDNSFTPFTAIKENNAADLCVSSDKHGSASVQKQPWQKTGDCPHMHAMMTKRTNPKRWPCNVPTWL